MSIEIKVPVLPESVSDATIAAWHKQPGEFVKRDDHLVDIETDKVVLEVVAPADGSLDSILKAEGATVQAQQVIALFNEGAGVASASQQASTAMPISPTTTPAATSKSSESESLSPAVRRLAAEYNVDLSKLQGSGKGGRITTADVERASSKTRSATASSVAATLTDKSEQKTESSVVTAAQPAKSVSAPAAMFAEMGAEVGSRLEKRVPMTRLRARIAERLVQAQHTAAILTTFNEVNMLPIMELRKKYKEIFEKTYSVRLGLMSFFTLAVIEALKHFPVINASVDGNDIVYHGYYDIGIAVSSPRGLVVPVLRNAETMTMDEIERQISQLAKKAETGQLSMEEITGGTFTITNGGVFGSLMATPILNPPQSGILGMHKIEERPVVENGQIVIRPMMYVALSYDHRIIDGAESVRFLVTVKELLEDPARLALGI